MSPSCIACEMISAKLYNLLWADNFIALCFCCFTVNILKGFCITAVAREKSRLVLLNVIPAGRSAPFADVEIETTPVITVYVIRPVSTMLVIALNCFIFSIGHSQTSTTKPQFQLIFSSELQVALVMLQGSNLDRFYSLFCLRMYS